MDQTSCERNAHSSMPSLGVILMPSPAKSPASGTKKAPAKVEAPSKVATPAKIEVPTSKAAPAAAAAKGKLTPAERMKMIAEAAYYLAEKRGFGHGHQVADWATAEKQVDALLAKRG